MTTETCSATAEVTLRVVTEYGEGCDEVPASYMLSNWSIHREAVAVIEAAIAGKPGWFETPSGMMFIRRI
jgi:hypothetical protein